MKRSIALCALFCLMTVQADAALKAVGSGSGMEFDSRGFSPQMKSNYALLKAKCTSCHSLERLVVAYTTGVAQISGRPYDLDGMKAITYTMLRKANANKVSISKEESRAIAALLKQMLDESVR